MTGIFGQGVDFTNTSPNFNVTIMSVDDGFRIDWKSSDPSFQATNCLNLQSGKRKALKQEDQLMKDFRDDALVWGPGNL